jgi:NAD(P)-dependent dehydrogenase (short-subunit alcohol dehydrogenase family)
MSKTWFITGAGSGFGRELAQLLLQRGDRVAATVRKPDALQDLDLRQQGGGRIIQISSSVGQAAYPAMGIYAATKWGIEGFFEGTIPEIAPFGIEVTLVEPGASRTNFASSSADAGQLLDVYDQTPVGAFRRMVASAGLAMFPGDPRKVASAIIASAAQSPAPKRLTLGSDAYELIHAALTERLAGLEAQKELAHSTDVSA